MSIANPCSGLLQHLARGAEKVRPEAFLRTDSKKFVQQIHAANTFLDGQANKPSGPYDPHSVDPDHIAIGNIGRKHRIPTRIDELRDVQRDMLQPEYGCASRRGRDRRFRPSSEHQLGTPKILPHFLTPKYEQRKTFEKSRAFRKIHGELTALQKNTLYL